MNRRDFIESTVAGIAAASLPAEPAPTSTVEITDAARLYLIGRCCRQEPIWVDISDEYADYVHRQKRIECYTPSGERSTLLVGGP